MRSRSRRILACTILVCTIAFVALLPVRREIVSSGTMRVVDESGAPIRGLQVDLEWNDYSTALSAYSELLTDSRGEAVFPATTRRGPLGWWSVKMLGVILNVHGSFGEKSASIRIAPHQVEGIIAAKGRFQCSGSDCTLGPMNVVVQVPLPGTAESSTRAWLASHEAELRSFAEDWARLPNARIFRREGEATFRWNRWVLDLPGSEADGGSLWTIMEDVTHRGIRAKSLTEATVAMGITAELFDAWRTRSGHLRIESVETLAASGAVELRFAPGGHGLRYAPEGEEHAWQGLLAMQPYAIPFIHVGIMKPFGGRWFFFDEGL